MKKCFKCGIYKDLSGFYKHKKMSDGHLNKCKECTKKEANKHRLENLERIQEYDRNRPNKEKRAKDQATYHKSVKGKEIKKKATDRYRKENPLRYKANTAVRNALRDKRITRPNACSECGIECKPHGHHDDYSKPLTVRWLCIKCHNEFHKNARSIFREDGILSSYMKI